jgi:hypothetical protein
VRLEADKPPMDAHGAKLLAARIRAGVSVGMRIELATDAGDESGLRAGDRGVVHEVDDRGRVVVLWDRGFETEIDPTSTPFHRLAA